MQRCSGQVFERPFVGKGQNSEDEVDGLEDRYGLDAGVEVFGVEVEEEFGPKEALECGCNLV